MPQHVFQIVFIIIIIIATRVAQTTIRFPFFLRESTTHNMGQNVTLFIHSDNNGGVTADSHRARQPAWCQLAFIFHTRCETKWLNDSEDVIILEPLHCSLHCHFKCLQSSLTTKWWGESFYYCTGMTSGFLCFIINLKVKFIEKWKFNHHLPSYLKIFHFFLFSTHGR